MPGNRVRIIGGEWRSRVLRFAPRPGLRPTPDRVRETLFNWLGQDLAGKRCLDLFAGSGALGFEAASRHAARVAMVEHDPAALAALRENARLLGAAALVVTKADALEFLATDSGRYDIVFLDPPFESDYLTRVLPLLPRCLADGALVYAESPRAGKPPPGWEVWKSGRAGAVAYQLLKRT